MLSVKEREFLRKIVKNFIVKNPDLKKSEVVNHFVKTGFARKTVYNTLNKLATAQAFTDKKKTGRPSLWTSSRKQKLKRLTNNRKGVSQRLLAKKFSVSQKDICYQLSKMNISCRKREKTPKYDDAQAAKAKKRCRLLVNLLYKQDYTVIMDDEKYFTFNGDNYPGNDFFYTNDLNKCPESVRFKGKEKFPQKILVWIALSERGMSEPLFQESKAEAINGSIYLEKCLKERLLPYIEKYHSDSKFIFWPDLARAHYANSVTDWLSEKMKFVGKDQNPPNVPQARPIESFWGHLGAKVYEGGWEARTRDQLVNRIKLKLKDFDAKYLQSLMAGIKPKLRKIADEGVYATFKK